jgi:alpha-tubulin suppressor-like RCC1 family protein
MNKAKVYFWGAAMLKEERGIKILEPQQVKGFTGSPVQVGIGGNFVIILTDDGKVWSFGEGAGGRYSFFSKLTFLRLGHGNVDAIKQPKVIQAFEKKKIVFIHAGDWHSGAIDNLGQVYLWGKHLKESLLPEHVPLPEKVKYLQCGHQYTAVITG